LFIDTYVPFLPALVVPYLSFFILIPYALFVVLPTAVGSAFLYALIIGMWSAAVFWYFVPTGMVRPKVEGRGVFSRLVRAMYTIDGPCNNFPSSHVFVSLICGHYLAVAFPETGLLTWAWCLLVAASTVFVKQHYIADVFGGVVWAVAAITVAQLLVG
jgi:membrane-associated phospholipid phosphatase